MIFQVLKPQSYLLIRFPCVSLPIRDAAKFMLSRLKCFWWLWIFSMERWTNVSNVCCCRAWSEYGLEYLSLDMTFYETLEIVLNLLNRWIFVIISVSAVRDPVNPMECWYNFWIFDHVFLQYGIQIRAGHLCAGPSLGEPQTGTCVVGLHHHHHHHHHQSSIKCGVSSHRNLCHFFGS